MKSDRIRTPLKSREKRKDPEEAHVFATSSGIRREPYYLPGGEPRKIGFPGEAPFTRGIHPAMYRGRLWTMRQYAGYGDAVATNRRFRYLLEQGQTGLSVAFDLPTQLGLDPDDPRAEGEVGRVGVSVAHRGDMAALFDSLPIDRVTTSMTINAPAAVLLAMYIAVAESRGAPRSALGGTVQNDILKEYAARGTYIFPPVPSMRLAADTIEFCAREMPKWNSISVSGYHMREAGCTAVQEVAFTLADGAAYVEAALARGLRLEEFIGGVSFFFAATTDLLEEVAKFRAARRLWASLVAERWGGKGSQCHLRFHTQTAGHTLTAQEPENNVVRVTLQALAAVLGGTQSLHTNSMDEALALPTEKAARIALRTQQILAHESGAANTVDPAGGAYAVEALTDGLEESARRLMDKIGKMGGMVRAVESGFVQREISESAYRTQMEIESGRRVVVGVNRYGGEGGGVRNSPPLLRIGRRIGKARSAQVKAFRAGRDRKKTGNALDALRDAAGGTTNTVPHILEAVKAGATLGEICGVLRAVFGEHSMELRFQVSATTVADSMALRRHVSTTPVVDRRRAGEEL